MLSNALCNPNRPLVSIIINFYNGEQYLANAIESVLAQTYQNLELLLYDNLSTDSSALIAQKFEYDIYWLMSIRHSERLVIEL